MYFSRSIICCLVVVFLSADFVFAKSLRDLSSDLTTYAHRRFGVEGRLAITPPEHWQIELQFGFAGPFYQLFRLSGGTYEGSAYDHDYDAGLAPSCTIRFSGSTVAGSSQAEINAKMLSREYLDELNSRFGEKVSSVTSFVSGPLVGYQVVTYQSVDGSQTVSTTLSNPKVAAHVSCNAWLLRFPTLEEDFDAVARSILLEE